MGQQEMDWTLDAQERRVLAILRARALGQANALPMPILALEAGLPTRKVQEVVQNLVVMHGILICSSSRPGVNGYWIPLSEREIELGRADLIGRITHLVARLRGMERAAGREFSSQVLLDILAAQGVAAQEVKADG